MICPQNIRVTEGLGTAAEPGPAREVVAPHVQGGVRHSLRRRVARLGSCRAPHRRKYCKRCETTEERRARSVCARLYVVRPHQVFGAETAFAETARFIKVSALIR